MSDDTNKCPTCGKSGFSPPWLIARQAGFNPAIHCLLLANRFGRVAVCKPMEVLGRTDCSGGDCPIAARYTAVVTDKHGRTKEIFKA